MRSIANGKDGTNILPQIDISAAHSWEFPSNPPPRKYQIDIAEKALFNNTLVVLPTGLGKTLIAAVVLRNFNRWYPKGTLVFMVSFENFFRFL